MKNIKEVMDDKKFILIVNLLRVLHREHLELARLMLMLLLKPDTYKEVFSELEPRWEKIFNEVVSSGLNVKEEDFND